ncbi:hypothetical protein MNBD_GAMMA25-19 [hydrothermal vent metagenome]|uniref:Uncharacterized protein n=1 Tax=hydrothermal vent metagenome TaxID=652676 RepID=A0A3B1BHP2_9ZZZZ
MRHILLKIIILLPLLLLASEELQTMTFPPLPEKIDKAKLEANHQSDGVECR